MRNHTETAEIIQLFGARTKRRPVANHTPSVAKNEEGLTETAKNSRLRSERRDVWREADAVMGYWLAAMKMHAAISILQNFGAVEVERYPFIEPESHGTLVKKWRAAWALAHRAAK